MTRRIYFSVADRQIDWFLDPAALDRSLILNTFFQNGVLIPDIFWFISEQLERHVLGSSKRSLLEGAVAEGFAVPAFRHKETGSFPDALAAIRRQGIQAVRTGAEELAERLQVALDTGTNPVVEHWPNQSLGQAFDDTLDRCLARNEPPKVLPDTGVTQDGVNVLWDATERWRIECLAEAREETRRLGDVGVRRGALMNAVGQAEGLGAGHVVDDVREIFSARLRSPAETRALQTYCGWMSYCYQVSGASVLGATPNFPAYDPMHAVVLTDMLPKVGDHQVVPVIRERVLLPPLSALRRLDFTDLLRVRREHGSSYLASLHVWNKSPSSAHEALVREELKRYCEAIMRWSKKQREFYGTIFDVVLGSGSPGYGSFVRAALGAGAVYTAWQYPEAAVLAASGVAGFALYAWQRLPAEEHEIAIPSSGAAEANLTIN